LSAFKGQLKSLEGDFLSDNPPPTIPKSVLARGPEVVLKKADNNKINIHPAEDDTTNTEFNINNPIDNNEVDLSSNGEIAQPQQKSSPEKHEINPVDDSIVKKMIAMPSAGLGSSLRQTLNRFYAVSEDATISPSLLETVSNSTE